MPHQNVVVGDKNSSIGLLTLHYSNSKYNTQQAVSVFFDKLPYKAEFDNCKEDIAGKCKSYITIQPSTNPMYSDVTVIGDVTFLAAAKVKRSTAEGQEYTLRQPTIKNVKNIWMLNLDQRLISPSSTFTKDGKIVEIENLELGLWRR